VVIKLQEEIPDELRIRAAAAENLLRKPRITRLRGIVSILERDAIWSVSKGRGRI
jgi:hypothetical protein